MSKRKGTVSAESFLQKGYLPEAMLNFFMILGWAPKDQQEIISLDQYIAEFDPQDISSKSVVFDLQKLAWINGMYIRKLDDDALFKRLIPFIPEDYKPEQVKQLLPLVKERLVTLSDIGPLLEFFFREITVEAKALLLKGGSPDLVTTQLTTTIDHLTALTPWSITELEQMLRSLLPEHGWKPKQYFMMLRVATTGQTATPPLFDTLEAMGKEVVLSRLKTANDTLVKLL